MSARSNVASVSARQRKSIPKQQPGKPGAKTQRQVVQRLSYQTTFSR